MFAKQGLKNSDNAATEKHYAYAPPEVGNEQMYYLAVAIVMALLGFIVGKFIL